MMIPIATMLKKVTMSRIFSTFFKITASGNEIAVTYIINASTVPIAIPFPTSACTTGIIPAALLYNGIPIKTATNTAKGLPGPAYLTTKSVGI